MVAHTLFLALGRHRGRQSSESQTSTQPELLHGENKTNKTHSNRNYIGRANVIVRFKCMFWVSVISLSEEVCIAQILIQTLKAINMMV